MASYKINMYNKIKKAVEMFLLIDSVKKNW